MMTRRVCCVALVMLLALALAGCSGGEENAGTRDEPGAGTQSPDRPTSAARSRGVRETEQETSTDEPRIVVEKVELSWRTSPERGVQAMIDLVNDTESDIARAKGHVFLIARSSANAEKVGVYPWSASLVDGRPRGFRDGARVTFLDRDRVQAFIPYGGGEGYYDTVTLLVYDFDGNLVIEEVHSVEPEAGTVPEGEATLVL